MSVPRMDAEARAELFRLLAGKVEAGEALGEFERRVLAVTLRALADGEPLGVVFESRAKLGGLHAARSLDSARAELAGLRATKRQRPLRPSERAAETRATKAQQRARERIREGNRAAYLRGELCAGWLLTAGDVAAAVAELGEGCRGWIEARHAGDLRAFRDLTGWDSPPVDNGGGAPMSTEG